LGEAASLVKDKAKPGDVLELPYVGLEHIDTGNPSLRRSGSAAQVRSTKGHFRRDDILYGKLRPYLDKAVIAPCEGICSTDVLILRTAPEHAIPEAVLYTLHTRRFHRHAVATTSGTNLPRTSWSAIRRFSLALPPLDEQRKIVAVLNRIRGAIEATEKVIAATNELRKSLMRHLFTYGPVPIDQADQVPLKETEVGLLPGNWSTAEIGELFEIKQGKALSKKARKGIRPRAFLRTANVLWSRLDLTSLDEMDFTEQEESTYRLEPGDLLVCEGGDVGRTAMWRGEAETVYYQNHLHRLRAKREGVDPDFIMYWMRNAMLLRNLYRGAANRSTIANLSKSRLKSFVVPFPPFQQQLEIAKCLKAADAKAVAVEQAKASLDSFFGTVLDLLMKGDVRVTDWELPEAEEVA